MAWINGQWVDEDELQGMLYSGVTPTLPFYSQPSFTSPLNTLNQEATGNFSMWGTPAGIRIEESTTPQATTGGFGVTQDYGSFSPSISMLNDMIANQAPMVDTNIVTDMPSRPVTINAVPFHENMPVVGSNWDDVMPTIQSAPSTAPFEQTSFVAPVTDQDYINEGTIPPGTPLGSNINRSNAFLADEYRASTPSMIGLGTGWGQKDVSGIFGTPTVIGVPTADNQGDVMPDLTGNIDIPAAIDLGWRMTGYKPGLRNSGNTTPMPTSPSGDQTMYTDEGETDITDLMDKHFEDPNATKDVALAIAQNYQDNPQTQLWNDAIAKNLGLSKHDVEVANSLLGHVDSSDPNTTVTVAPGAGYAPAVTISEESTFQPGVVPTHTLGNKYLDEVVAAITKPTQTTTNWVDKPTPTKTAYTGPTKAELRAAAAAQRKADLAEQKAAARRAKIARQALKDSQAAAARAQAASAAQAKAAQKAAKAVLARMSSDRNAPSQAEINAAIEVMSQVDTFGGGSIGFDGGGFDPQGGETGSSGMGAWT